MATWQPRQESNVRVGLARLLFTREVGQRIPTVVELQAMLSAGSGTVVKGLRELDSLGAIELQARGRAGTIVLRRHVGRLWVAAELGNLKVAMPPLGPVEQQGISKVLQDSLSRLGIPVMINYREGARNRLRAVFEEQMHAAVTSRGAFEHDGSDFAGLIQTGLGPSTYYAPGSLVVIERDGSASVGPRRIGIDPHSYDHRQLTEAEFGDNDPEFIECSFVTAPAAVLNGAVDAAIWHRMPTVIPLELAGLQMRPLRTDRAQQVEADVSHASIVTRGIDAPTNAALRAVKGIEVRRLQNHLINEAKEFSAAIIA